MTQPYVSSLNPLGGNPIDSTEINEFLWKFNDPNISHQQTAYNIQYKENVLGSPLIDLGWINSNISKHSFPINTFQNSKVYAWRVRVRDSISIESNWSDWVLFKTSNRPQTQITFPLNDDDVVTSDLLTIQHEFVDLAGQIQYSYQYRLYKDDNTLIWTSDLFNDYNNLTVLPKGILQQSTYYKIDVTVTDSDGLSATSIKRRFYTNFPTSLNHSTYFQVTPDNTNSKMDLKWANSKSIIGNYVGTTPTYQPAKFGNGIEIKNNGEKLYWDINIPEMFTITKWAIYNELNNGTLLYLYKDAFTWLRLFYHVNENKFIIEKNTNGSMRIIGSPVVNLTAGQPFFYALKQTKDGLTLYIGNDGTLTKIDEWISI